jgi:hypothetical protein
MISNFAWRCAAPYTLSYRPRRIISDVFPEMLGFRLALSDVFPIKYVLCNVGDASSQVCKFPAPQIATDQSLLYLLICC